MAYTIEVTEDAYEDAILIFDWYDKQQAGTGEKFLSALESTKSKLISNPFSFGIWKKDIRRIVLNPFSYKLYNKIYGERVVVFLIAHERRSNQFLKRRIQKSK
jgi:hypothetical protein